MNASRHSNPARRIVWVVLVVAAKQMLIRELVALHAAHRIQRGGIAHAVGRDVAHQRHPPRAELGLTIGRGHGGGRLSSLQRWASAGPGRDASRSAATSHVPG